jgi:DMSO/TMAO reductase YedYZ heme-binding membrane subunit
MDTSLLDISSVIGLIALPVLTGNFLLGLMLSTAYKRSVYWKKLPSVIKKINIQDVHNWTAYMAIILVFLHSFLLLWEKSVSFSWAAILIPFNAPKQNIWVGLGIISLYAILIVIITTQKKIKNRMGFRFWKNVHLISYGTALLVCLHGIFLDPQLKDRQLDYLDGEKLLCELCLLVLLLATFLRIRYHKKILATQKPAKIISITNNKGIKNQS